MFCFDRRTSPEWLCLFELLFPAPERTRKDGRDPIGLSRGRLKEALVVFRRDLETLPKSVAANNGVGVVLDLMGRYAEARQYFSQAIRIASGPQDKVLARRALAIAWGFAGDCRSAGKYDTDAYELCGGLRRGAGGSEPGQWG